jgi:hypothetical protein
MAAVILKISDEMLSDAEEHSKERIKYEYNRAQYSYEQRISMITIGTLGQLGFKKILDDIKIKYSYQLQAGAFDDYDFNINNKICEIKTSGYDHSGWERLNLLYSKDQYEAGLAKRFDYCFQLFVNGYNRNIRLLDLKKCNTLIIAGFMKFSEIELFKNKKMMFWGDYYKVPIDNLSCFESFFDE